MFVNLQYTQYLCESNDGQGVEVSRGDGKHKFVGVDLVLLHWDQLAVLNQKETEPVACREDDLQGWNV